MNPKIVLLLSVLCISTFVFAADEKPKPEVYSASVIPAGGGRPVPIKIYVYGYTSDEEAQVLANALKADGPKALLKALNKTEKGRIAPVSRTGSTVGVVRVRQTDKGRALIMLTDRPISFPELWLGSRSTDYPFGIVQLNLDEKGKGEGTIIVAAKIKFTDDNSIEVESYGIGPSRLIGVKRLD
jgi:hypothetical protein